jgi:hypothetical protein
MNAEDCTAAEVGLVRWLRTLPPRTKQAIHLWLFMGDMSLLYFELTHSHLKAA